MTLYRVLRNIAKGDAVLQAGQILPAGFFDAAATEKLARVGALSVVSTPPISEVQGWETRARKLSMAGIITIEDYLQTDAGKIAALLRVSRTVEQRLRNDLEIQLAPPPRDGCEGCRD